MIFFEKKIKINITSEFNEKIKGYVCGKDVFFYFVLNIIKNDIWVSVTNQEEEVIDIVSTTKFSKHDYKNREVIKWLGENAKNLSEKYEKIIILRE